MLVFNSMENSTGWTLMHQNPPVNVVNPTALPPNLPYPNALHNAYYPYPQNPNPYLIHQQSCDFNSQNAVIHPPGIEPVTVSHISSAPEIPQLVPSYTYLQSQTFTANSSTAVHHYYHDPNVQFALDHFATGTTVSSTVTEKFVGTNATPSLLINQTVGPRKRSIGKKGPKKIKIVQSAWCEVCKVDCNSKRVLDQHKLGKKHKKNLEKLIVANACILTQGPAAAPAPAPAPVSAHTPESTSLPSTDASTTSVIGPNGILDKAKSATGQKARKKAAEGENLETKRRKILEGGAAAKDVRMCTVCNVVCNSETVFRYHLAGQKHATMMKKCAAATGMAATT